MTIKYTFSKAQGESQAKVMMKNGEEMIFVTWIGDSELAPNETKSQAIDRMLNASGYEGREDFWNTKKARECETRFGY